MPKKLFSKRITPLQFARKGEDYLKGDKRNKLFEKQRREYGFASCDFWNFHVTFYTLVRNCAIKLIEVGVYPGYKTHKEWVDELERVVELADSLLNMDEINGVSTNKGDEWHFELMNWLNENLNQMWY